tara:strand:- start:7169 stop:8338 length:1170 start_codon:yes stop_codon:yes gene_type:complete
MIKEKPLYLAIDASSVKSEGGIIHLASILSEVNYSSDYVSKIVIWCFPDLKIRLPSSSKISYCIIPSRYKNILMRLFWQLILLPRDSNFLKCEAIYVPSGICFNRNLPVILFLQNLLPFQPKEMIRYGLTFNLFRLIFIRFAQGISILMAKSIIFPSFYASNIIRKSLFYNTSLPYYVVYHGVNLDFVSKPLDQISINNYSLDFPFIISYISIIDVYKHHLNVFRAVKLLIKEDNLPVKLNFIGSADSNFAKKIISKIQSNPSIDSWFSYYPNIKHSLLKSFYSNSDLIINASSCESFGLSVLEAMACGKPIAASKDTVFKEILGESANYFDCLDYQDIYSCLRSLIYSAPKRTSIVNTSQIQIKRFSWASSSRNTFRAIFESVRNPSS